MQAVDLITPEKFIGSVLEGNTSQRLSQLILNWSSLLSRYVVELVSVKPRGFFIYKLFGAIMLCHCKTYFFPIWIANYRFRLCSLNSYFCYACKQVFVALDLWPYYTAAIESPSSPLTTVCILGSFRLSQYILCDTVAVKIKHVIYNRTKQQNATTKITIVVFE